MDPNFIQKRMEEIQKNDDILDAFSRIVSGKPGYKTVIEKKPIRDWITGTTSIDRGPRRRRST